MRNPFRRLLDLLILEKKDISAIYFYAILSGLINLALPIGIQAIIGFVLGATMVNSIYVLIGIVLIAVLAVGVMQINQMRIIEKIQQSIFVRNALQFTEVIPKVDLWQIDKYYMPEKVNRFFDTVNVQKGISKLLLEIPTAAIQIIFGLLLLAFYHPIFIGFDVLLIFIVWIIIRFTSKRGLETSIEESNYKYKVVSWLEEMARVIKSFKFSQGTHLNLTKTDDNLVHYLKARTSHFRVLLLQYKTLVFFKFAITAIMLFVGTSLLLDQQLNIGEFIAAEIVILTIIGAVEKLIVSIDSVYDVVTGLEKLASVTELSNESEGSNDLTSNNQGLTVQASNLNFSFSDNEPVIKNVSFVVNKNELAAISGSDGSGKSTLLSLLSGNYKNFTGSLLINNLPIQNYTLTSYRQQIGIFHSMQDIFEGTVWENISLNRPSVSLPHVMQVAQDLGIENVLENLEMGLDTEIQPLGRKLNSSTIKKILLLRAMANNPTLLLLEDPWAGIEQTAATKIKAYLINKKANATVLIITKNQEFIQECDKQINLN